MDPELTDRQRQILKQMSADPENATFGRRLDKVAQRFEDRRIWREVALSLLLAAMTIVMVLAGTRANLGGAIFLAILVIAGTHIAFGQWRRYQRNHRGERLPRRYRRLLP